MRRLAPARHVPLPGSPRGPRSHQGRGGCWGLLATPPTPHPFTLFLQEPVASGSPGAGGRRRSAAGMRGGTGHGRRVRHGRRTAGEVGASTAVGRAGGSPPAPSLSHRPSPVCLAGGDVTFDISNDAPTMAGADATFSITLRFPRTQEVLPDGRIVWSQNCTVNGGCPPNSPAPGTCTPPAAPPALTLISPQAPAWPRVTLSSRSHHPGAPTASSPMGAPFPLAPVASAENSSTSGGHGVRPETTTLVTPPR